MSTTNKAATITLEQIAEAASVGRSAVSNWRARHKDFPTPDSNGRFLLAEVEQWLIDKGKIDRPIDQTISLWSATDDLRSTGLAIADIVDLVVAGLVYLEAAERFGRNHPDPAANWERIRSAADDQLASALLSTAEMLEDDDPTLEGLLTVGLHRCREIPGAALRRLIDAMASATDSPRFEIFEDVVRHFESLDRFYGAYATPEDLVELAVRLGGTDADVILDPAVGQGGLLLSAAIHPDRTDPPKHVQGFELSRDVARRARARFYLYGVDADIRSADALRVPFGELPDADLVLVDPPFSQSDWGDSELYLDPKWTFGSPPRNDATFAWAQIALGALAPGGRAVVFTAAGPLFRSGRESEIRRALVEAGAIEVVIELPPRVRADTGIKICAIVMCHPDDSTATSDLLLVDASTLGSAGRTLHSFDEADLDRIVDAIDAFRTGDDADDDIAWTVDRDALAAQGFALEPSRYRPLPKVDLDALLERRDALHASLPHLIETTEQLGRSVTGHRTEPLASGTPTGLERERLGSIATVLRGVGTPASDNADDPVIFGAREVAAGASAELRRTDVSGSRRRPVTVSTGDLVVTLQGPSIRTTTVTERHDGAVLGMDCAVIRPRIRDLDRGWLQAWFQSGDFAEQAQRAASATTAMRHLSPSALEELSVPIPEPDAQQHGRDVLDTLDRAVAAANDLRTALEELRSLEVDLLFSAMSGSSQAPRTLRNPAQR